MPKDKRAKSVLAQARSWATRNRLFGTQAFLRFVIFTFVEKINLVSNDFIFKGGNLLWIYIHTPRATVDLDLSTFEMSSHSTVRKVLEEACQGDPNENEILFSILSFHEVEQDGKLGAAVTISYKTEQGAKNSFDIDIVYALPCDSWEIDSPVHQQVKIKTATVENIVIDKISACHRFGSGNSRMKDYDDLWRLSKSGVKISAQRLATLAKERKIILSLNSKWIGPNMERVWNLHRKRYKDLPESLDLLIKDVNAWLASIGNE